MHNNLKNKKSAKYVKIVIITAKKTPSYFIAGTTNQRIKENFEAKDIVLDLEDIKRITDVGVVAVVRAENEEAFKIAEACIEGGLPAIELTFTVPNAHLVIKKLSEEIPESDLILGAGTVLNEEMATLAIDAGAKYIVSPGFDEGVAVKCLENDIPYMPGCLTITEMMNVKKFGVEIIKLFPGSAFGPSYVKAVKGPLPDIKIMPTGGVGLASHHYMDFTGVIRILDVNTLDEVYSLNTKGYIITYRLIDNVLYLFQMSYRFEGSEPRMTFDIKQGHMTYQKQIDIGDILFFNESAHFSLNYITSINLTNFHIQSKAFLGNIEHIYVSQNSAYIAIHELLKYTYNETTNSYDYTIKTRIVKYDLPKDGHIHYKASVVVNGRIINPYAMDEYDGMFRVVTTVFNKKDNRLYIFKESKETDEFIQIGYLTEGIGKENESVKSVRFNEDRVNIVTFYQTDPNYTIDLKDPTNPTIIGIVEEPGYSTYMHPWGENRLIGLGYDVVDGRVTRIKLSTYSSLEDSPLETYFFDSSSYYYAAALYDPRMIMVDKDLGIFAFLVTGYSKTSDNRNENTSNYYIFKIDFDQKTIIQEPFIVKSNLHSTQAIERAVYINGIIYTLSYDELKAVRVVDIRIIQTLNLNA